ncbi:MAG: hypothetical protein MZV70_67665 [Desulfobacterales bacterium]|nr:hypothetical protein [Desulfobacterales bacterium]
MTEPLDSRDPRAEAAHPVHPLGRGPARPCTAAAPPPPGTARTCKDGAAHMSWVMVNKRAHMRSTEGPPELDRGLRDVRQALSVHPLVEPPWPSAWQGRISQTPVHYCGYDAVSPAGDGARGAVGRAPRRAKAASAA